MDNDLAALAYRYLTDPAFWVGGITIPVIIGVTFVISGAISDLWARIQQFFESTEVPGELPTDEGPSPFQKFMTCVFSSLILLFIVLLLILFATFVVPRLARY